MVTKCPKCDERVEKDFIFCPYCGIDIRKEDERKNYGMLGIDDESLSSLGFGAPMGLGGLGGLNGIFNNLMKEMTKQMENMDIDSESPGTSRRGFKINIGLGGDKPMIKIDQLGNSKVDKEKAKEIKIQNQISPDRMEKLNRLPKEEAKTGVRRLSNKIVYEIELPGVKSLKDIMITKLEEGIEIRAFSEDKSYFKNLAVTLPITKYNLEEGKLVLELKPSQ